MFRDRFRSFGGFVWEFAISYKGAVNLNYFYNFGFIALVALALQIVTGIILGMHYIPEESLAFWSVEHIMRDVNYGFLVRYMHANGASLFFIAVYLHMFKGLYYGSFIYPREFVWASGVVILFLMVVTAFLGYVLP
jgi:ubiquinol-cytochrome c reductase cytochrome b/c1 subunit